MPKSIFFTSTYSASRQEAFGEGLMMHQYHSKSPQATLPNALANGSAEDEEHNMWLAEEVNKLLLQIPHPAMVANEGLYGSLSNNGISRW